MVDTIVTGRNVDILEEQYKASLVGLNEQERWLRYGIKTGQPALMIGETGTGKTYSVLELAKEYNARVYPLTAHPDLSASELIGKFILKDGSTVWVDGIITAAIRNGYWLIINEINAVPADVLFILHGLFDDNKGITLSEKDNEIVHTHADFRFFASMNPCTSGYAGTKDMNMALISRFSIVIGFPPYTSKDEAAIVQAKSGCSEQVASVLVDTTNKLRELKKDSKISHHISTRDVIQWAAHVQHGFKLGESYEASIGNKVMDLEDWKVMNEKLTSINEMNPKLGLRMSMRKTDIEMLTSKYTLEIEQLEKRKKDLARILKDMEQKMHELTGIVQDEPSTIAAAPPEPSVPGRL